MSTAPFDRGWGTRAGSERARRVATALLLCVGMVVIPLVALGASGGAAARAGSSTGVRSRAARSPRETRPVVAAPVIAVAPTQPSTTLSDPGQFTQPLAVAASAPAATASHQASVALAAPPPPVSPVLATAITPRVAPQPVPVGVHPPPAPVPPAPIRPAPPASVHPTTLPPTSAPPPPPAPTQRGLASWYWAPNGTCAHPTLPFGTVLTIVDLTTGKTATCRVEDRGPYATGRIVDLSPDVFARLEPLGDGIADVTISW